MQISTEVRYRAIIGCEACPGRVHLGILRLDHTKRVYSSARIFGRWFRLAFDIPRVSFQTFRP